MFIITVTSLFELGKYVEQRAIHPYRKTKGKRRVSFYTTAIEKKIQ